MNKSSMFMLYLAGLSMLGFLATDMYLPAFTAMRQSLNASANAISASLSLFLAGFALAQLVWGKLSDRIGRRPVLIIGLSLFAIGCLGMLWVNNTLVMLMLRFIQAVGVCSASVVWQALIIDRYQKNEANHIFATIMPLVALSPALAPLIGAWLLNHYQWQAIFVVLLIITLLLLISTWRLTESRPFNQQDKSANQLGFMQILSFRIFYSNVIIYAACSAAFFAWLTGSPFILSAMGYGSNAIGLSYFPQTIAFLLGGYGYRNLIGRTVKGNNILPWLLLIYSVSVISMLLLALYLPQPSLCALLLPFCVMALVNGAIYPIVVTNALTPFSDNSGKAAALQNAIQLTSCFIASACVSAWVNNSLLATTSIMASTILVVLSGYILISRK